MRVFPGGVALSDLTVYDWEAADGCQGGSPHLHTASSEGYVVISGSGAVETLSRDGFASHSLEPGDALWFTPGTVHRLVNNGDLRLFVVMANNGLPEAGDAVLTFAAGVLEDPGRYAAASAPQGVASAEAARIRRDLAMEGYLQLREGGKSALEEFHRRAVSLVRPKVERWTRLWESTVAMETEHTRTQLTALAQGRLGALPDAAVARAERNDGTSFGMCGQLGTWRWSTD